MMRNENYFIRVGVEAFLRLYHRNMFLTANVTSWMFDGIDDPVLDIATQLPDLPISIPYDKFGWFYEVSEIYEYLCLCVLRYSV